MLIHARTIRQLLDPEVESFDSPGCRRCRHEEGHLARYIQANGATALRWVCDECGDYTTFSDLPRWIADRVEIIFELLPVCQDNRDGPDLTRPCCICGRSPGQEHHWAPTAIFPDWEERAANVGNITLITVPLCQVCHRVWHDRLRDYGLRWPHEVNAA